MGYNALGQDDFDHDHENSPHYHSPIPPVPPKHQHFAYNPTPPPSASLCLFLDAENTSDQENALRFSRAGFEYMLNSTSSRTKPSYAMLKSDEEEGRPTSSAIAENQQSGSPAVPLHIPRPKRTGQTLATLIGKLPTASIPSERNIRTASGRNIALRHPTPDLQTLKGAYTGNIKHLEETAERLSMTSSIEHAIKELHDEQKRSDSRRSSLLSSQGLTIISPQVSNASSIVEVNSAARSGGYSPAGYMMSPSGSFSAGRVRSSSKGSRFGRPEPELEGRPLDSFSNHSAMSPNSSSFSIDFDRTPSIAEGDEENSATMTRGMNDYLSNPEVKSPLEGPEVDDGLLANNEKERPVTPVSMITIEREKMFEDFDGTHNDDPPSPPPHQRRISESHTQFSDHSQQRMSSNGSGSRLSMVRPQSYADPSTGQQMVYYPAPVPMMLNLPQKLSKNPSSMARNKRRSQVLSSIPAAARNSAIWLPDVLEQEDEAMNEETQQHEYIPQHQRASMGGRRLAQDLTHMPPQLRANTYFDLPSTDQVIEMKEQSAVATLDSILDASAHAPVSAFTDHAFAGALGNEVYGRPHVRNSRSTTGLIETTKKRTSSFNILRGLRSSSSTTNLLDSDKERRRATMSGVGGNAGVGSTADVSDDGKKATHLQRSENGSRAASGEQDEESSDDGQPDETYRGPPTTLLAELQLRKQRQKQRTAGLATAFPNGMHSTLLEMDAVAEHEKKSRKQKRTFLAWEDPSAIQYALSEDDEDVPLAMLYAQKSGRLQDATRPLGLMERREQEDNEPLSRRRDRLQGKPPMQRASTMMNLSGPAAIPSERAPAGLPEARPVSGDFATEIMSQFGDNLFTTTEDKGKGKLSTSPVPGLEEEEETLGQRRKRLQAEREARAKEVGDSTQQRPALQHMKRRSMADLLQAHPSAGADRTVSYQRPASGLLGLHERKSSQRASSILDFTAANAGANPNVAQKRDSLAFKTGQLNDGRGGITPAPQVSPLPQPNYGLYATPNTHVRSSTMFAQPTLPASNGLWNAHGTGMGNNFQGNQMLFSSYNSAGYAGGHGANGMGVGGFGQNNLGLQMQQMQNSMMGMQSNMLAMGIQPLNQGQIDMVERWRQSVMH